MIAVVIPYFQREPGILQRALRSVFAQEGIANVEVVVVDDASPIPAGGELKAMGQPLTFPVTIIERINGGPAAARNTALDNLPVATRYVAFLDSDDQWSPDHLANAVSALSAGYDVYFADHLQLGADLSAFQRAGRIHPDQHPVIDAGVTLRAFDGDMFHQIMTGNVIGTSTVVYDIRVHKALRFRTEFTHAGEDYLFWMELARNGARFAFSTRTEAVYGKGVNVYAASGWGTEQNLLRIQNEIRYRKFTSKLFPVTPEQAAVLSTKVRELRLAFMSNLLHLLAHGKGIPTAILRNQFALDPVTFSSAVPLVCKLMWQKSRGKS
ncbi:glycosyltransferase family 2 protein [Methylocaldum sp.]|uniref:glycosyltransferase family 2 protein n=1 Tax=Methylocaldum sp. TaxID=1969727 RepID=UPI00321FFF26